MRKLILIIFVSCLFTNTSLTQQRMIVKPRGFNPSKIFKTPEKYVPVSTEIRYIPTPFGYIAVYPNIRILPTSGNQTELSASIWISTPNYIFVGANSDGGQGYYYTTNGGSNWNGGDLLPGSVLISSDPSVAFDITGKLHFNYFDVVMVSDKSTNGGANWLGRVLVPSSGDFDKSHNTVDVNPSSPYSDRIYVAWTDFSLTSPPIVLSYSQNGGVSYSSYKQIGQPVSGHYEQGCNLQVGPNSEVYCVWAAPFKTSPFTEDFLGFTKSNNGGANWSTPVNIIDINGIRGRILSTEIRTNSFPSMAVDRSGGPRNGYVYITWAQRSLAPAGSDADICFSYSSNSGTSWSTPVRVNDDALNNGKQQFFPWMTVDQTNGNIFIAFFDTRDVSSTDSCDTYMAVSPDGGSTFINLKVSDHAQRPAPLYGYASGYYGDYIGIAAHNNKVWPFWMDNRNGPAQVYSAKISIGPIIQHTPLPDTENLNGPYVVNAKIITLGSGLVSGETKVYWGRNVITDVLVMTNSSGNNWTASIPGNGSPAEYRYFIRTIDQLGRESKLPTGAPTDYFSFYAGPDTIPPVISHTPIPYEPISSWPSTVTAEVTDNIGIDSVWVRWYINNPTTIKQFKLNHTSGNIYSADFNSTISEVSIRDSIYYRIIAQDNSSLHNKDSTILYKFEIFDIENNCFQKTGPPKTIHNLQYTYDTVHVPDSGTVLDVNVRLINIQHPWDSDLDIYLLKSGRISELSTDNGGSGDNYIYCILNDSATTSIILATAPMTGTWKPETPLDVFNFINPYGDWILRIYDDDPDDEGTLVDWCVEITYNTYVGIEKTITIPNRFSLNQNFPNPFNPLTKIQYSIAKRSSVNLTIYDILGREITTLVNEVKSPGVYIVDFNGANLSSGIYFYKLEAKPDDKSTGDFVETKKMLLIK